MSDTDRARARPLAYSPTHPLLHSATLPAFPSVGAVYFHQGLICEEYVVLDFFKRRKLSDEGEKRLVVALARAEESIIEAHVECALDVIEAVGEEMPIDRVLELYLDALEDNPQRAEIVARRVLSRLNYVPS
jgi:hypothetical protein